MTESEIFNAIVTIHNFIGHAGQDATAKNVSQIYYGVTRKEIVFLIKPCEICHWKAPSKSKGLLKPIILTKLFERVQIDLTDMRSTPDVTLKGIYKWIAHHVCCISKSTYAFCPAE